MTIFIVLAVWFAGMPLTHLFWYLITIRDICQIRLWNDGRKSYDQEDESYNEFHLCEESKFERKLEDFFEKRKLKPAHYLFWPVVWVLYVCSSIIFYFCDAYNKHLRDSVVNRKEKWTQFRKSLDKRMIQRTLNWIEGPSPIKTKTELPYR